MPRPRPPHLQRERSRHGKVVWYVRVGKGPRIRLRMPYGAPGFDDEYMAAVRGEPLPGRPAGIAKGSLRWLWDGYRETDSWLRLAQATRKQRENIMLHVLKDNGDKPAAAIRKAHIVAGLDRRAKTPSAARNFLDTVRGMFAWALERGHVQQDPTATVKPPRRRKGGGFPPWTRDDVETYQKRWPLGTRQRVWLDVILYTGLRRGDAVRMGKQHVRNGVATLRTEKGGETITVTLPVLAVLQHTLDVGPTGDLAWICGARGEPFTKEGFGNEFSDAARSAGVRKSAHGVRKIAATIAAENGATEKELEAIFGWIGGRMASLYTRDANRVQLAAQAMAKLDGSRTSPPAPDKKVRVRRPKQ